MNCSGNDCIFCWKDAQEYIERNASLKHYQEDNFISFWIQLQNRSIQFRVICVLAKNRTWIWEHNRIQKVCHGPSPISIQFINTFLSIIIYHGETSRFLCNWKKLILLFCDIPLWRFLGCVWNEWIFYITTALFRHFIMISSTNKTLQKPDDFTNEAGRSCFSKLGKSCDHLLEDRTNRF